ncbi:MAG: hypothetical protein Fur0019_14690 [Tibeticola sp.]
MGCHSPWARWAAQAFDTLMRIDPAEWAEEPRLHDAHLAKLARHLPAELSATPERFGQRLQALAQGVQAQ